MKNAHTEEYQTLGRISAGKLSLPLVGRKDFDHAMTEFEDGEVILSVTKGTKDAVRSYQSLKYYWGKVIKDICKETYQDKRDVHDFLCRKFRAHVVTIVNRQTGEIDEQVAVRGLTGANAKEMTEFVEQVRLWAAEFLGLTIENPDKHWRDREVA